MAVFEFGLRHADRALMVRPHHRHKSAVDIAGRLNRHIRHHLVHGGVVLRQEWLLVGIVWPIRNILDRYRSILDRYRSADVIRPRLILCQGERRRRYRGRGYQRNRTLAEKGARKQNHLYLRTESAIASVELSRAQPFAFPDIFLEIRPKILPTTRTSTGSSTATMAAECSVLN